MTPEERRKHNQRLVEAMRNGEDTRKFDKQQSWFPERPIIKKDPKAIQKLYGKGVKPIK